MIRSPFDIMDLCKAGFVYFHDIQDCRLECDLNTTAAVYDGCHA